MNKATFSSVALPTPFLLTAISTAALLSLCLAFLPTTHYRQPPRTESAAYPDCSFLNGTRAAVFLHTNPLAPDTSAWREIFDDQIATLRNSPLIACAVPVYVGLPDGAPWPMADESSAPFLRFYTPTSRQWPWGDHWEEEKTLAAMFEFCADPAQSDTDVVAYSHDKGTRTSRAVDPVRE